jgi:heme-degrading monooxygenase HmoA
MVMRIWRTGIEESRSDEYRRFAEGNSVPMFSAQAGFVGVFFAAAPGTRAVVTFWESAAAAEALEQSASYLHTVEAIVATGILCGPTSTEIFELEGAQLTGPFVNLLPRMGTGGE